MSDKNDEKSIKETKKAIRKAQEHLEEISSDEHERYLAELREKYIRDQAAVQEYGYIKGKEEGIEEGKLKIASNMLKSGIDIETISKVTELTIEEIKKISH